MKKLALITVLFDYPDYYQPTFYNKGLKFLNQEDIHIIRLNNLTTTTCYYEKFYFYKIIKLYDYLVTNILNKYEYVLFMDAIDTAFVKPLDGLLEKFLSLNCSILFGAEKELWPITKYVHLYDNKEKITEYCFLNSGTYFGYTDKIVYYLKDMIDNNYYRDDQGCWSAVYLLNNDIMIDQKCDIFFSTHKSKNKIQKKDNIILIDVNAHIIHDNGGYHEETLKLVEYFQ